MVNPCVLVLGILPVVLARKGCSCYIPSPTRGTVQFVSTSQPHQHHDIPASWDWRDIDGNNYCTRVLSQQVPNVCGSCWAEAATGALSDRYRIATGNRLTVQLGVQNLLNFRDVVSGGSCLGGDDVKAYRFIHKYGISDDTCAPFAGVDHARGFVVANMEDKERVQNHQCYMCDWDGSCDFVSRDEINLYGVDEYGTVQGVEQMKAEIYSRGPISCNINSEPDSFDLYKGGIIRCDDPSDKLCKVKNYTDHVIVIAGWGFDAKTQEEYWVGRNSYGTRWGEGSGGGWFRLLMGSDVLNLESSTCGWAVPSQDHVRRAIAQFESAL